MSARDRIRGLDHDYLIALSDQASKLCRYVQLERLILAIKRDPSSSS